MKAVPAASSPGSSELGPTPDGLKLRVASLVTSEIRRSRKFPGFYEYPFELSHVPDARWSRAFRQAYEALVATGEREAYLVGRRIVATVDPGDDKQRVADAIGRAIEEANLRCNELWVLEAQQAERRRQAQQDDDELLRRLQKEAKEIEV